MRTQALLKGVLCFIYIDLIDSTVSDLPSVTNARYDAEHRTRCLEGTRVELLETIRQWIIDPSGKQIFWLRGQAGMGKTTVSLSVADECDRQGRLGGSFIFSRDQADRSELRHFFPTIAHQLGRL